MKNLNNADLIMIFKFAIICYGFAFVFGSVCYVVGNFVAKKILKKQESKYRRT